MAEGEAAVGEAPVECEHDFADGPLSMTCRKCLYAESTYY